MSDTQATAVAEALTVYMGCVPDTVANSVEFQDTVRKELTTYLESNDVPGNVADLLDQVHISAMAAIVSADTRSAGQMSHSINKSSLHSTIMCLIHFQRLFNGGAGSDVEDEDDWDVGACARNEDDDNMEDVEIDSDVNGGVVEGPQQQKVTKKPKESGPWTEEEERLLVTLTAQRVGYREIFERHITTHSLKALQIHKARLVKEEKWMALHTEVKAEFDRQNPSARKRAARST